MASPPLVLDDILADSTPPRRKPQEAAQGPINLDEVLGDFGDVQGGSSTAPAPRRGIVNAIGESLGTLRDPFNMGAATTAVGNRLFPSLRGETRTMVPPVERRTPDQIATDERAAAAKQYGRTPAEETATPTESYVQGPGGFIDTAAGVGDLATQQKLQARSTLQGRFSPEKWRQVAVAGMQYANTLHAAGRHDEAEDVLRKAYNAQLLSEGSKEADTPGAIMLSNLLGIVKDPYAGQRRNIAEATQPGMVASPEEQQAMGVIQPTAPDRPFSVAKDIAAPLAGMAPAVLAGGLAGRTLAAAGAGLAERAGARTIGSALGRLATETQIPEMLGPKIPVTSAARLSARIAEEANEFKAALPSMLKRGATEGQLVMGTEQYRMARQQGASVEQAIGSALQGAALNVPLGALAETGLGIAGRAAGVGFDPIGHIAQRIYDRVRSSQPLGLDVAPEGEVPPAIDQTPEAAHRQIGDALSQILNQKQTAETAENARVQGRQQDVETAFGGEQPPPADRAWWEANAPEETPPSAIEPAQALRFRGQEAENPPLRTAAQIAMERGSPTDEANAVVKMQRQAEFTQAARAEAAAAAQEPDLRLEQAAQARPQEVQGPRTLGETLDEAAQQREQGEPLASDYHDAINNYVDALAQIRDLPEDQAPTMRQQVSLARAKAALNAARSKYGRMLGASAVAALAANDDELTDKEKKFGGLAAVGMLGVPEGEHAPVEPEPGRFVSRLRTAVEGLQGKRWDAPVPAADWIGKLKGLGTFSKGELKLIQPDLEAAQAGKTKLDRADVLRLIEQKSPQIERVTLKAPERAPGEPLAHFGMGDPEHITDIDEVDTTNPDELQEQIANRGARVRAIESDIERQQEGARADMEERQTSMDNEVEHARGIIENDLNLPPDYLDPAIGYLDEHIEGDYIPRGAVDEAFEQIIDNLSEGRSEGRDIDEVRQELEDKGYTIEEEPITERRIGFVIPEEHYGLVRRHNGQPGDRPHEFTFGMGRPEDHPDQEHIDRARELFGDEAAQTARIHKKDTGETRVVVKDAHGKLVDWGMSEDGAITNAAQKVGIETGGNEDEWDDHVGSIKHDLQDYANARASWGEAESMHSSMTEDEESHFRDEHQEMDRLREEAGTLNDHLQAAEEAAQIPAPAQAPALAQPADPHLMPVEPPVKGSPHFSTYQRIGGGTNYRELLNSWSNRPEGNIPESAYGGHDYWDRASTQNVIGHVRAEDHIVHDIPGTEGTDIKVLDSDDAPVRRIKSQLAETRGKRDKALQQLQDLAQEFDRLPQEQRTLESTEGSRIAAEYGRINNDSVNISKRESALSDELREASGIPASAGQRVAVMIENQASLAQHQSHLGPAPTPEAVGQAHETRERAFQRLSNAREAYARVNDERETAQWAYAKADEAMPEELRRQFHQTFSDAYSTPPHYHIDSTIDNPESGWARQFQWLEAHGSPAMGESIRQLKEIEPRSIETARATDEADRVYRAADRDYDKLIGAEDERIDTPFNDTQASIQLNAARFLIDSAERGYDRIAWSDAANRVRNAHQQLPAARYVYDQATPGAMKRLLNGLGFKDVPVEKMYIKGEGHWTITLRPEMRQAIRRVGLPILGAIALVGAPSEAKAEDTASGESSSRSLYSGMVGGLIAGGALAALLSSKKLRRLVKENRELNRALMIDDLSGLANKKAFSIARHPIDADPHTAWVALGASQFKKVNDVAGHDAGDQTIAHFGHAITAAAKEVGIPMRGFRAGGDEFAFAVPKGREAEFIDAVERASQKHVGGVETQLHGASGETYAQADALLNARKEDLRTLNPSLRRETVKPPTSGDEAAAIAQAIAAADLPKTEGNQPHLDLHANPIGPALRQLVRYPAAASMVGLGALMGQSDNPNIQRAGIPTMILGAMSAIGSHRLSMAADVFGKGVISLIGQTDAGRRAIEFVQPDILLSPAAKRALEDYRQTKAYGRSVALEHARTAQRTGPAGDRAISDVIENEGWEDVSNFTPEQMSDVLTAAAGIEAETRKLTRAKLQSGVLTSEQVIPNYLKREYAHFDVLAALADSQGGGAGRPGKTIGEATKSRVLDEPIHSANAALADAQASGDAQRIKAAEDALTEAQLVQQQQRTTLGEIREASYRVGKTFDQGWSDVAAAKLHETLRNIPGTVHPEYAKQLDDFLAARDLAKQATTTADRDAAKAMMDAAYIQMREIGDRYKAKDADWRTLPDTRSYGVLRGMPVTRAIHSEIAPQFNPSEWDNFLNFWKQSKTIFNPGTSIANVASNVMFSHMEGLPLYSQPKYLTRAIKDMRAYGPATRHLSETGVLEASATFSPNEIRNPASARSEEGLSDLFQTTRPETRDVMAQRGLTAERIGRNKKMGAIGRTVVGAAVGTALMADEENPEDAGVGAALGGLAGFAMNPKVRGFIRRGYANEDNLFRVALYLKKLDDGIPPKYAAQYAKAALGDMSAPQSPLTQNIRRWASPFFLYPLRAIPRFAQQAIDHPWRYVSLMGMMAALDLYGQSQVGQVPERDLAPADRRDSFGYFLPGFTQLPMMDEQGNKGAVDMARWTPLSAMTSSAPAGATGGAISDEFPSVLQPSGPLLDLGGRLASNVDPFSGKPLVKKDYPAGENVANVLNQAGEIAAPSFLAFHRKRLEEDVRNRDWEKFKNDVLGPTGMRPRFIRPGGEVRQATYQLTEDLNAMKHEFAQAMIANKNPARAKDISDQYLRRVTSALAHFSDRIGPPPPDVVNSALDTTVPR